MIIRFFGDLFHILLTITRPFSDAVLDIVYRIVMGKTKPLPAINDKILLLSATELAERIRKRKLKAETVMAAYIKRVKDVQPIINAVTDQRYGEALKDAKEIDLMLANTFKSEDELEKETPLLGVPFTCKESNGVKSLSLTKGLVSCKGQKAASDSEVVALLRKAGAIPVTVTNVPILLMWWETANHVFGMTRNPFDHIRTVGGSSGGEGALISAAGAVFGIGSDIAGSIRIPASFCSIYGHKPTLGVISTHTPWPMPNDGKPSKIKKYVSFGPMCRYVQDLTLLMEILAGDTGKMIDWHQKVDFSKIKIYYMEELPGIFLKATNDVKAAVVKAARHFEQKFGAQLVKLTISEMKFAFDMWECKLLELDAPCFKEKLSEFHPVHLGKEFFKSLFRKSDFTWPALYYASEQKRKKGKVYYNCLKKFEILRHKMENIFEEDAILLLPTYPEPPLHYLLTIPKMQSFAYTCIFNILGYPSSQIPAGLSNGLPIGIQAVSKQYKDNLTLAAAVELDKIFNGWVSPCALTVCNISDDNC